MNYEKATGYILADFERKPEGLEIMMEEGDISRYEAMRRSTALVAANFVMENQFARTGQLAQGLSAWHRILQGQCEIKYRVLTIDPEGPLLSREEANENSELLTIQAIRRGVRDAMRNRYRWAHGTRSSAWRQSRI